LGELLLLDALKRALMGTAQVAWSAVVVDAKDDAVRRFHERHDFQPLPAQPPRLFYPMNTIALLFPEADPAVSGGE
jgi:hypothetical protein